MTAAPNSSARSFSLLATLLLASLGLLGTGCEYYEKPNRPMPDLGLVALDGTPITLESMKGTAWVINIWLPGCSSCVREIPDLESARAEFEPRGVRFLAISIVDDPEAAKHAAAKVGLSMAIATATGPVLGALGLGQVPSTVFVSKDGRVVALASGERGRTFFQRRAAELLVARP